MATIEVRNVVINNPRVLDFLLIDSSPIYSTIDGSVSVTGGSFTIDDKDFVVSSASHTFPQLVREHSFEVTTGIFYENQEIDVFGVTSYYDGLDDLLFGSNSGKFIAESRPVSSHLNSFSQPFSPPFFYTPNATGNLDHGFEDIVEITDTTGTPPSNVSTRDLFVTVGTPIFTGDLLDGDFKLVVLFGAVIQGLPSYTDSLEIDASAFGSPELRDIRGTYGATSTDDNGIEYVWSITLS